MWEMKTRGKVTKGKPAKIIIRIIETRRVGLLKGRKFLSLEPGKNARVEKISDLKIRPLDFKS